MKDRLFPLKPGTKEPAISDWQTKAGKVETNGNVGIATGKASSSSTLTTTRRGRKSAPNSET